MTKNKEEELLRQLPEQHRLLIEKAGKVQREETLARLEAGWWFCEFGPANENGGHVFFLRKGPKNDYRKGYDHLWILADGTIRP